MTVGVGALAGSVAYLLGRMMRSERVGNAVSTVAGFFPGFFRSMVPETLRTNLDWKLTRVFGPGEVL